jgi:predicted signal transduction protein with EAL and GGDEF domain
VWTAAAAREKCEQLQRALHRELDTNGTKVRASLGLALYPDDADGLEPLMQAADAAMYRDKRSPTGVEGPATAEQ